MLKGDLPCSHDLAVKLSSYALQGELAACNLPSTSGMGTVSDFYIGDVKL